MPKTSRLRALAFKFRHIFVPLFALSLTMCVVYSALNWFLVARDGLLPLDADIADLWLPGIVSWVLLLAVLYKKLLLLKQSGNVRSFYHLAALAAVAGPTLLAQVYVSAAAGAITHLHTLNDLSAAPLTRFYSVDRVCLDRDNAAAMPATDVSGKNNDSLDMSLHFAVPVCGGAAHKAAWIGLIYRRSTDNLLPFAQKNDQYQAFQQDSYRSFEAENPAGYTYFERVRFGAERKSFENALKQNGGDPRDVQRLLIPHHERFAERGGDTLWWVLASYGAAIAVWLVLLPLAKVDTGRVRQLFAKRKGLSNAQTAARLFLIPTSAFYGLPLLIDINLAVYIAMVFAGLGVVSFQMDDLLAWGANYSPALQGAGLLRLFTSQFVHGGLLHVLNNMYGLFFVGILLMPAAMNARLIACYLVSGLGGGLASAFYYPATVSVGASGAIFGLCGVLLSLLLLRDPRLPADQKPLLTNIGIYVALNLAIGGFSQGIDNAAHVGGLVTGLLLGCGLFFYDRRGVDVQSQPER